MTYSPLFKHSFQKILIKCVKHTISGAVAVHIAPLDGNERLFYIIHRANYHQDKIKHFLLELLI